MQEAARPTVFDLVTRPTWFAPILLLLSAGLSFFYADRNMPIADEGALLTAAARILDGGVFYRDIDAYAFPGVSYLLAGAMSIFGEHLSVARALAGGFFCATVLGVYACAITLVEPKRAALCGLTTLSLKFFAFPIYTMFFYADASIAAALWALALFLRRPFNGHWMRPFGVGVLTALAIVTKQPTGIYLGAVFFVILLFPAVVHGPPRFEGQKSELGAYLLGLSSIVGSMAAYFASQGVFVDMIESGLLRPFTGYLPTGGVSFWTPLAWWNLGDLASAGPTYFSQLYVEIVLNTTAPIRDVRSAWFGAGEVGSRVLYSAIPIAFGACLWLWFRVFRSRVAEIDEPASNADALARARFFSAAAGSLAMTASAFPRADFIHIITIYPAVILILFAISRPSLLGRGDRDGRRPLAEATGPGQRRRLQIETAIVTTILMGTIYLGIRHDATLTERLEMDRAAIWVKPRDAWLERLVAYVRTEVPQDAPLFVYGHEAHWYFLTDRYMARPFSQLYPGMTGDETGEALAALIREIRPKVILQGVLRWPGMPPVPEYTRVFKRTLDRLYAPAPDAFDAPPANQLLRIWRLRE